MSRRRHLVPPAVVLIGAVAVTGLAGLSALSAADALGQARTELGSVDATGTNVEQAQAALHAADTALTAAEEDLDHWSVDVVSRVPVLGRSWRVERGVAETARHALDAATALVAGLPAVAAQPGGVDLAALSAVEEEVARPARRAELALERLRSTDAALTPGSVRDGRLEALAALEPVVRTLHRAVDGMDVMGELLGASGERSVLVMLQNNAELRGAGGYAATFATGRTQGGRLVLGPLRDVLAVADPPERARRVPAPAEYREDYGPLSGDTTIWRSWNMSPHVPDSALVGARVAEVLLGQQPDLVVLVDVPAMGALARLGGGSVTLPNGSSVSPDELVDALLVDAYADAEEQGQAKRRAELQRAASTAVSRLLSGGLSAPAAARTVVELAAQRHVSVWSARPREQSVLAELGLAGALAPEPHEDLAHVSVNNIGGNKLDRYVDRQVHVEVEVGTNHARVVQRVRFRNDAPDGLVPYVAGTRRPGVVVSRVELSLPTGATDVGATVDGRPWHGALRAGETRQRVSTRLDLPRGASSVLEVRYALPVDDGCYRLRVVPQALAQDARLRLVVRPAEAARFAQVVGAASTAGVVDETSVLTGERRIAVVAGQRRDGCRP